ncbi:hypothetical protein HDU98_011517 [Podochytrium sp. JEL0797]|nr:hypothetical protein HDU98_011517 [Podochytrium sp. JEL0797]
MLCAAIGDHGTSECTAKIFTAWVFPLMASLLLAAFAGSADVDPLDDGIELAQLETAQPLDPEHGDSNGPSSARGLMEQWTWLAYSSALVPLLLAVLRGVAVPSYGAGESALGLALIVVLDVAAKALLLHLVHRAFALRVVRIPALAALATAFAFASTWDLTHYTHESYLTMLFPLLNIAAFSALAVLCVSVALKADPAAFSPAWLLTTSYSRVSDATGGWPEYSANIFSRISFSWMGPLISLAASRPLTPEDLWDLDEGDKGGTVYARFAKTTSNTGYIKGTLLRILINLNFSILAYEYAISLVDHLFIFGGPFFIRNILKVIENPDATSSDIMKPVFGLLFASLARTACESQLYWVNRRIDTRIRSSLVGAIYMKGLTRMQPPSSKDSAGSYSDGAVSNLMSADTDKVLACFRQSHYLLSVPFLLILCFGLLVGSVGWAGAIAGMLSLSLAVPATKHVGKLIKKYRKELMGKSDVRVSRLQEILNGIRTIKLFAWEPHFHSSVSNARTQELDSLHSYLDSNMMTQLIWRCSPILASGVTFLVHAIANGTAGETVDAATAFTVLALYNNVLRYPLFVVPKLAISVMELNVSLGRIEAFLLEPELASANLLGGSSASDACGFSGDAAFNYGGVSTTPVLRDLNLSFPADQITTIIGKSGSGKSSMLLALLGELKTLQGKALTPIHPVSYVSQTPFLLNTTIRENILFSSPLNFTRYAQALHACSLNQDLAALPLGDLTPVSDRGASLSGGQRARIALARALYAESAVLLLDDVLSAVDATTARHLVREGICGELGRGRTRIAVASSLEVWREVSGMVVVVGEGGVVVEQGEMEQVIRKVGGVVCGISGQPNRVAESGTVKAKVVEGPIGADGGVDVVGLNKPKRGIKDELAAGGNKASVEAYKFYLSSAGGVMSGIMFVLSIVTAYAFGFLHDYTLKLWSDKSRTSSEGNSSRHPVLIYVLSVVLAISALYARFRYQIYFSSKASSSIYTAAFSRLINAPISFFDATPQGQVMNRFGKDTQLMDQEVARDIGETVHQAIHGLTVATMISFASPVLVLFAVPIAIVYIPIARKFMSVTRSLKRLESGSRSPVYSAFGETLA